MLILCFRDMEVPFSKEYFEWEKKLKMSGWNVVSIVTKKDSYFSLPIVSGDLKAMSGTLREISRSDALPGEDFV